MNTARLTFAIALVAGVFSPGIFARAEILDAQSDGFTVRSSVTVAAGPGRVWDALSRPQAWWNPEHTYSGKAANLSLDLRPGGIWRETLPGGGVQHMVVVNVQPEHLLRLEGALGPLQAFGVAAHLTLELTASANGTTVTQTYDVGGHAPGGLDKLAAPVDEVLASQLGRLKLYVETGSPR